jgi:hypothetical protein
LTFSHETLSVSVEYYMERTTFSGETFEENYASGGKGIIDIIGFPRIFIESVSFKKNGDSI